MTTTNFETNSDPFTLAKLDPAGVLGRYSKIAIRYVRSQEQRDEAKQRQSQAT